MKALVTGGNGFIGSWVCRELRDRGHQVRVLALPGTSLDNLRGLEVDVRRGDLLSADDVGGALDGCEAVFHLAALHALWLPRYETMYRVNVDGTEQLLRLAAAAGVRRVVHTSTQNTVGQLPSGVANEDCAFAWWNEASHYTRSKLLAEQAALAWAGGGGGLEVVVVNPSGPFGPGDLGPGPTGKTIVDFIRRRYPVVIDGMFNAIDVADLAHAEVEACLRGQSGRRYLLGGHDFTIGEFFALLEELTSVPAPRWRLPRSLALGLAQAMELASDHLTRRPPKLTVDRIRQRGRVRRLDCSRARAELGLRTTPIRDTLARAIAWFREVGYV